VIVAATVVGVLGVAAVTLKALSHHEVSGEAPPVSASVAPSVAPSIAPTPSVVVVPSATPSVAPSVHVVAPTTSASQKHGLKNITLQE
jgi:hypothetical protein